MAGLTNTQQHWISRLRGAPPARATAGFYVTGRTGRIRVIEDLAGWMRNPDGGGLAVVTGSPGTGKSAMLALPVLLTDGQGRDALVIGAEQDSLVARAADLFDALPVIGIHARGMNPNQVADAIAEYLGRSASSPEELLEKLEDDLGTTSWIVVIDAVDEARDPYRLLTGLLLPLARLPGLRVVVGARRHVLPSAAGTSLMIDLDTDRYRDPQALADYTRQLLVATHEPDELTPYRHQGDEIAATVAAAIAGEGHGPAHRGQGGPSPLCLPSCWPAGGAAARKSSTSPALAGLISCPPTWAQRSTRTCAAWASGEPAARVLLAALAWAKGPGLPWERIWVPVAQIIATHAATDASRLGDNHVRWLLNNA